MKRFGAYALVVRVDLRRPETPRSIMEGRLISKDEASPSDGGRGCGVSDEAAPSESAEAPKVSPSQNGGKTGELERRGAVLS